MDAEVKKLYPQFAEIKWEVITGEAFSVRPITTDALVRVIDLLGTAMLFQAELPEGVGLDKIVVKDPGTWAPIVVALAKTFPGPFKKALGVALGNENLDVGRWTAEEVMAVAFDILTVNQGLQAAVLNFKNLPQGRP